MIDFNIILESNLICCFAVTLFGHMFMAPGTEGEANSGVLERSWS